MARNILKTGKKTRPKTALKGKRYLCAKCHKRSPKPVLTPAPWYCPGCRPKDASEETEQLADTVHNHELDSLQPIPKFRSA